MIEVGQIVRWRTPNADESAADRYDVIEVNGDRCFIRYICDMALRPVTLARVADLIATPEGE